jgi:diacylglycerol kinase family enzyme
MAGIGIITNPHSKANKKMPARGRLLGYIVGQFGNLEITNSVEDLGRVAALFLEQKIEVLAINGGDGTISRTLTAFIRAYGSSPLPKILVLRGGTMNMLADNLGIRGTPEEILVRMLECESGLRPRKTHSLATLLVGGQYGFLFGNGFVARYLAAFYKHKTGPVGALWLIVKIYIYWLFGIGRYKELIRDEVYRLLFDGVETREPAASVAMMVSTVERMPLGLRLFPWACQKVSQFQFFSLEIPAKQLPWRLPFAFLRNSPGRFFGKWTKLASSVVISAVSGEQPYTLDGELFEAPAGRLAIEVGPIVQFVIV